MWPKVILETPRLIIRELTKDDCSNLTSILGDPEIMKFSVSGKMAQSKIEKFITNALKSYKDNKYGLWALTTKLDKEVIGIFGLIKQPVGEAHITEISYRLKKIHHGKGYATEAVSYIIDYANHNLGIRELVAFIEPENTPSIIVAEKNGMHFSENCTFHQKKVKLYKICFEEPNIRAQHS